MKRTRTLRIWGGFLLLLLLLLVFLIWNIFAGAFLFPRLKYGGFCWAATQALPKARSS